MKIIYLTIFCFVVLASFAIGACPEPKIQTYDACIDACPDVVQYTLKSMDCINVCLGKWDKMQDDYYACTKAEREAIEKKRLEEEKKFTGEEPEKTITVSTVKGAIWLTNSEGLVSNIVADDTVLPFNSGDTIYSNSGSRVEFKLEEGMILDVGPETAILYLHGELHTYYRVNDYWMYLVKGISRFKTDPAKAKVTVVTPGGNATDRNTDFVVEVNPDTNMTAFYLYEGILDVNTTKGDALVLNSGQMMTLSAYGDAKISDLEIEDWSGLVESIETGINFTPSWNQMSELFVANQTVSEEQFIRKDIYAVIIMAVILLILLILIIFKRKKK